MLAKLPRLFAKVLAEAEEAELCRVFHRGQKPVVVPIQTAVLGVLPNGTKLGFEPGSIGRGFNSILKTTHRQNFLVPPRAHRSFPLSEIQGR